MLLESYQLIALFSFRSEKQSQTAQKKSCDYIQHLYRTFFAHLIIILSACLGLANLEFHADTQNVLYVIHAHNMDMRWEDSILKMTRAS